MAQFRSGGADHGPLYRLPAILRDFLSYHETIKGQSPKTIQEYYLDLRIFLRFMMLVKREMPYSTDLNTIDITSVDLQFIEVDQCLGHL